MNMKFRDMTAQEIEEVTLFLNSFGFKVVVKRIVQTVLDGYSRYDPDEFITRKELAKRWNVHTNTIASYHDRTKYSPTISHYPFGKNISYKWSDCLEFAQRNFKTRD